MTLGTGSVAMRIATRITYLALALGLGVLAACAHDSPTQPESNQTTVRPPVPGVLTVQLTTPHSDDAALVVTVSGASISDVGSPSGMLLHVRQRGDTVTAAVFGRIASGEVLHFSVPDVNAAARYVARVVQVADSANAVRGELSGYGVKVER